MERVFIAGLFLEALEKSFVMNCPKCKSEHVVPRQTGKRAGTTVGFFTGAAVGAITVLRGAQTGVVIGAVAGPMGSAAGGLAGAALAALFAGSAGGALGAALGIAADENLLDNRECTDCGFTFREEPGTTHASEPGGES
jgi:hypothetical protein